MSNTKQPPPPSRPPSREPNPTVPMREGYDKVPPPPPPPKKK